MTTSEDPQDIIDRLTRERDHWEAEAEKSDIAFHRRTRERDEARKWLHETEARLDQVKAERDELQAKSDEAENDRDAVNESANFWCDRAAENRPTLDREAVREVISKHCGALGGYYMGLLEDDLMALAPAAENRPTLDR